MISFILGFVPILSGFWLATQKFASLVQYDNLLGPPSFIWHNQYYYFPWRYFSWYIHFHSYVQPLLNKSNIYIFAGLIIGLFLVYITAPKKRITIHGSACWANYKDILKMDFISSSGVIIGLYDSSFNNFLLKLLNKFGSIKDKSYAFAEMEFDKKVERKRDFIQHKYELGIKQLSELEDDNSSNSDSYQKLSSATDKLRNYLDKPIKYDPKKNSPHSVYLLVLAFNCILNFYASLSHFYLRDKSDKHVIVYAPTRSGKGVGLILPTLLHGWTDSVLVNDIKSENWGISAGRRKKMGQITIKFEPTASDGSSARWNILEEIDIGTSEEIAQTQNVAAILADYEGTGKADHWTANAASVITLVILHLKYAHYSDPENYPTLPNLTSVASFLKSNITPDLDENGNQKMEVFEGVTQPKISAKGFLETLKSLQNFSHVPDEGIKIKEWDNLKNKYVYRLFTPTDLKNIYPTDQSLNFMPNTHPFLYRGFVDLLSKPENECGSIISSANTALKEYVDPILSQNTAVSDFCINDLMNHEKPLSVYLVTPPADILRLSPILRLFFEMTVKKNTKEIAKYKNGRAQKKIKHPCLLLMDEFSSLGNLQGFTSSLSFIAGYGLKAFLICQGMPQINSIYGKDNHVLMNIHLKIFYAPNEEETAEYIEKMLGPETVETTSETNNNNSGLFDFNGKSVTKSYMGKPLMDATTVKKMQDQEIIMATGHNPVLTTKAKYYQDSYFTDRLYTAPIASDLIRDNPYPKRDKLIAENKLQQSQERLFGFNYDERLVQHK